VRSQPPTCRRRPARPAAAAAAALKGPPIINYRLNFGALSGGSVTTAPITAFVNFIVKEVLVGMLVWPKRITVSGGSALSARAWGPRPRRAARFRRGAGFGAARVRAASPHPLRPLGPGLT
jgi:hypothetical protein